MNILRAEHFLRTYAASDARIQDFYDDDEMLRSVLLTLFPSFEYPDFAGLTFEEVRARYARNPQPLPGPFNAPEGA
jgi:hypothetical protein